jgi:hypothetical protein
MEFATSVNIDTAGEFAQSLTSGTALQVGET